MKKYFIFIVILFFASCYSQQRYEQEKEYNRRMKENEDIKKFNTQTIIPYQDEKDIALEEAIREGKAKCKKCPLIILKYVLENNLINIPEIILTIYKNTPKEINAFEINFECYNAFGDKVRYYGRGSNVFKGMAQNINFNDDRIELTWTLIGYEQTTLVKNFKFGRINYVK